MSYPLGTEQVLLDLFAPHKGLKALLLSPCIFRLETVSWLKGLCSKCGIWHCPGNLGGHALSLLRTGTMKFLSCGVLSVYASILIPG